VGGNEIDTIGRVKREISRDLMTILVLKSIWASWNAERERGKLSICGSFFGPTDRGHRDRFRRLRTEGTYRGGSREIGSSKKISRGCLSIRIQKKVKEVKGRDEEGHCFRDLQPGRVPLVDR